MPSFGCRTKLQNRVISGRPPRGHTSDAAHERQPSQRSRAHAPIQGLPQPWKLQPGSPDHPERAAMDADGEETKEEPHWELDDKARALAKQQEIAAREADEQRKQQELIDAYAHSVARDAANDGKDDWSELRTADEVVVEGSVVDSLSSYLFGSKPVQPESPKDQLIRDAILDEGAVVDDDELEREKQESALRHWKNYDIATSLKPQLVPEREYLAALKICRACRIFNQRREAARRQQSVGNIAIAAREATKIKRAWRPDKRQPSLRALCGTPG